MMLNIYTPCQIGKPSLLSNNPLAAEGSLFNDQVTAVLLLWAKDGWIGPV